MQSYTLFNKLHNFSDIFFSKIKFYNYFYKIIRKICTESNKTILDVECYIYYIMYVYNNVWCVKCLAKVKYKKRSPKSLDSEDLK